jgi:hypothetical protein
MWNTSILPGINLNRPAGPRLPLDACDGDLVNLEEPIEHIRAPDFAFALPKVVDQQELRCRAVDLGPCDPPAVACHG